MSVSLYKLLDASEDFDAIEIMAPDYDAEHIWLWRDYDGENRLDLSRSQMAALHKALGELLGK